MLECRDLTITVPGRTLLRRLSFTAKSGEFTAVLGRNGSGKTLTLHTLAGLRNGGDRVHLGGEPLCTLSRRYIGQRLGLLMQSYEDAFPSTVIETALIGRHPHIDFWRWETAADYALARDALTAVELEELEHRSVDTLSGGERRRLAIATVITQDPDVILLDEPTNHLDPHHQLAALELFRGRAGCGKAIVAVLHDASLAARFADSALLIFGDGEWLFGPSYEVLNDQNLTRLYATPIESVRYRDQVIFVPT